jgi:hypothetical protein
MISLANNRLTQQINKFATGDDRINETPTSHKTNSGHVPRQLLTY